MLVPQFTANKQLGPILDRYVFTYYVFTSKTQKIKSKFKKHVKYLHGISNNVKLYIE